MRRQLPVFPLNTVVFPGVTLPLHVFEDRYRALVHHLLKIGEKPDRVFGIVAIREGYEVGKHGVRRAFLEGIHGARLAMQHAIEVTHAIEPWSG